VMEDQSTSHTHRHTSFDFLTRLCWDYFTSHNLLRLFLLATNDGSMLINRHYYRILPASRPLRSWMWRSPTVSQSVSMFRMSCRVHRLCMLCEHCAIMVWWTQHCRLFSSRLLLPSVFTLPVLGMAFARQLTEIVLRQSSAEEYVLVSVLPISCRWKNWSTTPMILCLDSWCTMKIMYCISCCLQVITLTTTCDLEIMIVYWHRNLIVL